jgi:hypothetical protein
MNIPVYLLAAARTAWRKSLFYFALVNYLLNQE